ncbi:DUF4397 domain-containing protein [Mucilaginibacter sp.]|uniref:DUF4397 domain-containing protein n=1 Tax=Mucilaginibacter sp. TaxID=1882438 RepID=UPI003D148027
MTSTNKKNIALFIGLFITGVWVMSFISSCGKTAASSSGLNVKYQIINLSPDLNPIDLYIDFNRQNPSTNPFIYSVSHGYFYVTSLDTPYQIRSHLVTGTTILARHDILRSGVNYTLMITGNVSNSSVTSIFTADTASSPAIGRGKIRFVNASPTGTTGLDVYANGTLAFSNVVYPKVSSYIELPNGNYNFQLNTTGASGILKTLTNVIIQDGRLYTLYAYGYTSRADSASFNAAVITNK